MKYVFVHMIRILNDYITQFYNDKLKTPYVNKSVGYLSMYYLTTGAAFKATSTAKIPTKLIAEKVNDCVKLNGSSPIFDKTYAIAPPIKSDQKIVTINLTLSTSILQNNQIAQLYLF